MKTKMQTIARKHERNLKRFARDVFAQSCELLEALDYDESEAQQLSETMQRDMQAHSADEYHAQNLTLARYADRYFA